MSKPFIALLKVGLTQSFDFRKKDKAKNASLLIPLFFIFIAGALLSVSFSLSFSFILVETGNKEKLNLILYAMAGMAAMLSLVTGVTKTKGTLFGGNDYDMLASLPIPKRSIIFVKLFSLYLIQTFYSVVILLPATIVVTAVGQQALLFIDGLLCLILSPIVPLILSGIVGIFIGSISDRFRFGNFISAIFYVLFLGVVMYTSFVLNSNHGEETYDSTSMLTLLNVFGWFNPTSKLLTLDIVILPRILYVVVNLIVLGCTIWVFAGCYDYFHVLMTSTHSHQKYVEKKTKQKGQFKALLFLDFKRYFSSKMYFLNTITGGFVSVICTGIMIVSFTNIKDPEAIEILNSIAPYFVLIILWCIGLATPASVAINMEGKNLWQLKTLPISYKQYSLSKILFSYFVLAPFALIASIVLFIYTDKTIINGFVLFLTPQIYLFGMCCIGYFINMYFYKLKWSNETEAVKNSAGTVISMLLDFSYTILLCVVLIVPGVLGFFLLGAILTMILVSATAAIFLWIILKKCSTQLASIEC